MRSDAQSEETLRTLKDELKSGLAKMNCLELSSKFYESMGDPCNAKTSKEQHLKYKYLMQLRQMDPSLKDDFEITFPGFFTSMNQKIFDIQLLERMSRDFEWSYQKVLIAQVKKTPTDFFPVTKFNHRLSHFPDCYDTQFARV